MRLKSILLTAALLLLMIPAQAADGEHDAYQERISQSPKTERAAITGTISAYTCGPESTGKSPSHPDFCRTASGKVLTAADEFKAVAADPSYYAFGTKLYIEGVGVVTVVDTGGDIVGPNRFDLFVSRLNADLARTWGVQRKRVWRVN